MISLMIFEVTALLARESREWAPFLTLEAFSPSPAGYDCCPNFRLVGKYYLITMIAGMILEP
jgi:hypothetical protein